MHSESYSQGQRALQDCLPVNIVALKKLFNALALIGTTCIVVAHLKTDTSTWGMDGGKARCFLRDTLQKMTFLRKVYVIFVPERHFCWVSPEIGTSVTAANDKWRHDSTWVSTWSLVQKIPYLSLNISLCGFLLRSKGLILQRGNAVMNRIIHACMHAWCICQIWWRRDRCAHAAASSSSISHNSSELRRWTITIPTFRNKRYGYKNKGCFDNVSIRHSNATIYRQDSILMSNRSQMITTCFLPLSSTFVNPWLGLQSCDNLSIKRPL
jgi:hypothetical protein